MSIGADRDLRRCVSALVILSAVMPSCSTSAPDCSGGGAAPFVVRVEDAGSGVEVCNAIVSASDGASSYPAEESTASSASDSSVRCLYFVNPRKSGTFAISASAPGYASAELTGLAVAYDQCGQSSGQQWLTIKIAPQR